MRGAEAVIARVPAIEYHIKWIEVHLQVCGNPPAGGIFLRDCDHVGSVGSIEQNLANCYALFSAGKYDLSVRQERSPVVFAVSLQI